MSNTWLGLSFSCGLLYTAAAEAKPIVLETPPTLSDKACSFKRAICVHTRAQEHSAALAALDALERAWEAGSVLGVPTPTSYDAYVTGEPARSAIQRRDVLSSRDRAQAFSIIDSRASGCSLDFAAARELYAAGALERTPSIDEGSLRAESAALARLAVPCAMIDGTVFQSHPDRALVDLHVGPGYEVGASLFFSWADGAFAKEPGRFITATWAFAETHTTSDFDWNNEPDVFDVVRESLKDAVRTGSTVEDALEEFAIARATSFDAAPALGWDVGFPNTPRTLASPVGIAETGASYVRVGTKGHKPGARFRMDALWEEHAKLRWVVVKLDAEGHELARYRANAPPKATEAHVQIVDVEDASALLVVATNVGNWTTPFDPDDEVWEPHGWLLTIAAE